MSTTAIPSHIAALRLRPPLAFPLEDVMLKSTTSRRAILAGAVTLPIAAAGAAPALAEAGDDAELLRLGELLEPIERDVYAQSATDAAEDRAFCAEVEARTGVAEHDRPDPDDTSPEARTYYHVHDEILKALHPYEEKDEEGMTSNDRVWCPLRDRVDAIGERIFARKATLGGLAVQTRAIMLIDYQLWFGESERMSSYLRSVCCVLRLPPPVDMFNSPPRSDDEDDARGVTAPLWRDRRRRCNACRARSPFTPAQMPGFFCRLTFARRRPGKDGARSAPR
jgi:hypothetical protein